jgi:NADH-quinone oxidoreductase subunit D
LSQSTIYKEYLLQSEPNKFSLDGLKAGEMIVNMGP